MLDLFYLHVHDVTGQAACLSLVKLTFVSYHCGNPLKVELWTGQVDKM